MVGIDSYVFEVEKSIGTGFKDRIPSHVPFLAIFVPPEWQSRKFRVCQYGHDGYQFLCFGDQQIDWNRFQGSISITCAVFSHFCATRVAKFVKSEFANICMMGINSCVFEVGKSIGIGLKDQN